MSILDDFTASYVLNHPSILLNKQWTNVAKEVLTHFYELVDTHAPEWIEYIEEQLNAIDESSEKTLFELRSFLMNRINDVYVKHRKFDSFQDAKIDIGSKVNYCVKNKIIPFISEQQENTLIITVDIMKDLKLNHSIENLTALKDVGLLLGFDYVDKNANGKRMRVLDGTTDGFVEFINADKIGAKYSIIRNINYNLGYNLTRQKDLEGYSMALAAGTVAVIPAPRLKDER